MNTYRAKINQTILRLENLFFQYRLVLFLAFALFVIGVNAISILDPSVSTHPGDLSKWSPWVCPFHFLTNLLCPGCGLTRSFLALVQGQIQLSFYYHPLGPFIHSFLIYLFFDFTVLKGHAYKSVYKYFVSAKLTSTLVLIALIAWTIYRNVN